MSPDRPSDPGSDADTATRRGVLRSGAAALAGTPVLVGSGGVDLGGLGAGPTGVHVAYGADPATAITVGWSGGPATEASVEYGPPGGPLDSRVEATPGLVPGERAVTYRAPLVGLSPGTTYEYRAVQDGATSARFQVATAPGAPEAFSVTAVGDHGIADPDNPFQRPDTDDPVRVLDAAMGLDPAFHLGVGDISYANGHPSTWELYFETFETHYAETPFMSVPGNHEAEPGTGLIQYDRRLNALMPVDGGLDVRSKPRWYEFRYGNAAFVGLNTTADDCGQVARSDEAVPIYDTRCRAGGVTYDEVQDAFLERTLRAASADDSVTWTVVYLHGPFWTTAPDHAPREDLRQRWGALFDTYGVDLVLSGDNHVYERTLPIVGTETPGHGTTYVTNGTGGTSHYELQPPARPDVWAVRTNEHFGVTHLDVGGDELRVEYVDQGGSVRDEFAIAKDAQGRPTQADPS